MRRTILDLAYILESLAYNGGAPDETMPPGARFLKQAQLLSTSNEACAQLIFAIQRMVREKGNPNA